MAVVAGGGAAGSVWYVKGDLAGTLEAGMEKVAKAVERACDDMKLKQISAQHDALTGKFIYRTSNDKKVKIKLKRQTEALTDINIRVGVMGDQTMSQTIYDKIENEL
jgi:hypothetical protein